MRATGIHWSRGAASVPPAISSFIFRLHSFNRLPPTAAGWLSLRQNRLTGGAPETAQISADSTDTNEGVREGAAKADFLKFQRRVSTRRNAKPAPFGSSRARRRPRPQPGGASRSAGGANCRLADLRGFARRGYHRSPPCFFGHAGPLARGRCPGRARFRVSIGMGGPRHPRQPGAAARAPFRRFPQIHTRSREQPCP